VDVRGQRVRRELFEPGRGDELIAALLRPEIATVSNAVVSQPEVDDEDESAEEAPSMQAP
jgi:hypothetical protein